jgi:hypothetical protein
MSQYDNCGILFKNFAKKSVKHSDMRGTATINGKQYDVSAWEKRGSRGPFYSIKFTPKQAGAATPPASEPGEPTRTDSLPDEQKGTEIF